MWALSVTVSSPVLSTRLITRESGQSTVRVHRNEVESAIETARELRHVEVEGEFLVQEVEHLVFRLVLEQVDTGSDIFSVLVARDELELEFTATRGDTIGSLVVDTLDCAVLS